MRGDGQSVRQGLAALVVAAVCGAVLATVPARAAVAAPADPVAPVPAPDVVEGFSPYLAQTSCDPVVKPGTAALRTLLMGAYGGRDLGVTRACDIGGLSEHKEGRAWDWGLDAADPAEKAVAKQFLDWLLAPGPNGMPAYQARRLGVMYLIYDGRIWSSYRAAEGWRPYTGGESHGDHIHISLAWNGATKRTSFWTGKASEIDYGPCIQVEGGTAAPWSGPRRSPCPAPASAMSLTGTPLLGPESAGPYVVQLQRLLSVTPVTGFFGPITHSAVKQLQKRRGLPVTGTTTPATWEAARSQAAPAPVPQPAPTQPVVAGRALPARMSYVVVEGDSLSRIAKRWRSTVSAISSASGLRSDVITVGQVLTVPVRSGLTQYTWTKLRRGDKGAAVSALQTALRMKPKFRTGYFGPVTKRKVVKLQARHGWRTTGKVRAGVWRALGA